jgi:DNA-binding transcriptional MerR regulator
MKTRTYQIKDVAGIARVSTRTLRHYDEIGLLTPSRRNAADYRLYTDSDLLRLQQILIGRSLGLALEDIRKTIDDSSLDRRALLRCQREELTARAQATANMIKSIDAALLLLDQEETQETYTVDMKKLFDGFDPAQYEAEVEQRWGTTDSYKESARRTRNYRKDDWIRIKEESNKILNDAIELLHAQTKPDDPQAMDIAERYRLWVDRWFYSCGRSMHTNLAGMYEGDPRFAQYFNDASPGLASFISAAIHANAQRQD